MVCSFPINKFYTFYWLHTISMAKTGKPNLYFYMNIYCFKQRELCQSRRSISDSTAKIHSAYKKQYKFKYRISFYYLFFWIMLSTWVLFDYCTALYMDLALETIKRLQLVQNAVMWEIMALLLMFMCHWCYGSWISCIQFPGTIQGLQILVSHPELLGIMLSTCNY